MTNRIQELTVDETWRNEQDAWNNRSNYFVEMHNRDDRKAQVTEFLSFLKDENLLPLKTVVPLILAVVYVTMH